MNTAQLDDVTVVVPAYNEEGRIGPVVRELTDLYSNFSIRLFHSGFAVLLYDLWLLVDFLVQTLIDVVEFRTKLRMTAPRFRAFLRREVSALL